MNLKKLAAAAAITLSLAGLGVVAGPAAAQAAPVKTSVGAVGGVTTQARVCHYVTTRVNDPWYTCINPYPGINPGCYHTVSKLICD